MERKFQVVYEELRVSKEELRDFFEWIEDILKTERNEQEIDNSKVENEKKNKSNMQRIQALCQIRGMEKNRK